MTTATLATRPAQLTPQPAVGFPAMLPLDTRPWEELADWAVEHGQLALADTCEQVVDVLIQHETGITPNPF